VLVRDPGEHRSRFLAERHHDPCGRLGELAADSFVVLGHGGRDQRRR
jgi:hypothetical protein